MYKLKVKSMQEIDKRRDLIFPKISEDATHHQTASPPTHKTRDFRK